MNLNELKIEVRAEVTVSKETAEACLKLVQIYCNTNKVKLIGKQLPSGQIEFYFLSRDYSDPPEARDQPEEPKEDPKPAKTGSGKKVDRGRVLALYRAGWATKAIADDVGCSVQSVLNVIHELEAANAEDH